MPVSQWRIPEEGHQWVESSPGRWWLTDGLPDHCPQYRYYAPLAQYTGLFFTFADTPPTPEGILAFANTYGLLGLRTSPQVPTLALRADVPVIEQCGEAREDWLKAILTMRHTVTLWEWARCSDITSLAQQVSWDDLSEAWIDTHPEFSAREKGGDGAYTIQTSGHAYLPVLRSAWMHHLHYEGDVLPQLHVRERVTHPGGLLFPVGDVVSVALWYVQQVITAHLGESVKPCMVWDMAVDHYPRLDSRVGTLLSALWLQFALAVTDDKTYPRCMVCQNRFEVSPATARADKRYCSNTCRSRAYRKRQHHYQERSK